MSASILSKPGCCTELYELPIVEYLLGLSFHPGGPKLTRQLANTALVSPNSRVLDVACGIGNTARILATEYGASVTGCDLSAQNVQRATIASREAGLARRTSFVQGSAERLAFDTHSFDVAICECSLCLLENLGNAVNEAFRVLKPGGAIGVSDFFLNAPVPDILEGPLGEALCVARAPSADILRRSFSRAGFEHVRSRVVNWALTEMIGRVRRKLNVLAATGAVNLALPKSWGDALPVLAALELFIQSGGVGYIVVSARKP
jgi:arsenite methyltransferase